MADCEKEPLFTLTNLMLTEHDTGKSCHIVGKLYPNVIIVDSESHIYCDIEQPTVLMKPASNIWDALFKYNKGWNLPMFYRYLYDMEYQFSGPFGSRRLKDFAEKVSALLEIRHLENVSLGHYDM